MATGGQKRTRSERVAAIELPPGRWERALANLGRGSVLVRILLCLLCTLVILAMIRAWNPPLAIRTGHTPQRDIVARAAFRKPDPIATEAARERARAQVRYVYVRDSAPLEKLVASLRNTLLEITATPGFDELDPEVWTQFQPQADDRGGALPGDDPAEAFRRFRQEVAGEEKLAKVEAAVADLLEPYRQHGLLDKLAQEPGQGNQEEIVVYPVGEPEAREIVSISDVLIGRGTQIHQGLADRLGPAVADRLFAWLRPRLVPTLALDEVATKRALQEAAAEVETAFVAYQPGQTLVEAGTPVSPEAMELLRLEYRAACAERSWLVQLLRTSAVGSIILVLFGLCGFYAHARERRLLVSLRRLTVMLALVVATVGLALWASADAWRAEIVPLLLFGQICAIAYRQELALLFSGIVAFILVIALGLGLGELMILMGVTAIAVLQLNRVRSRSKLIRVGFVAAVGAVIITIVVGLLDDQPPGWPLLVDAARNGLWTLAAGFLMTGLLPFIEPVFGVLTDISLLELGDVSHPLLQELVRRAPSTYNHSITVGALCEAAADSINARGLLVRVGAYFHDIGKMLKPAYFIENQAPNANRHETLVPAMSTLVIIAHLKDGANLARQHHLPQPIIDLIEQHHGTTLVEFFYERANAQSQSDPNASTVEESTFRYPGPKPQTKEAGVLMLADAVESASRALVEPTPARIESLVREVAERRLDDGQFDESGLTLRELRTIENSLIKSLTAIYHARVKYPDQKPA